MKKYNLPINQIIEEGYYFYIHPSIISIIYVSKRDGFKETFMVGRPSGGGVFELNDDKMDGVTIEGPIYHEGIKVQ